LFEKGQSEGLFFLVRRGLKKTGFDLCDMTAFAAGRGPGSFTGLRIGLSVAKGFSFAFSRPVLAFSSLEAIAYNADTAGTKTVSVAVDARRGNVYSRLYRRNAKGEMVGLKREALVPAPVWASGIPADAVVAGDGVSTYGAELKGKFAALEESLWYPTPESISRLALEAWRAGEKTDAEGLRAVYLYSRDCQVKKTC